MNKTKTYRRIDLTPSKIGVGLVLVLGVALVFLARSYFAYIHRPEPALLSMKEVEIKPGTSFRAVVKLLAEEGVISKRLWFMVLARKNGVSSHLQAGEYTFSPGMTPEEILDMISQGQISGFRLIVPEGFTIFQIARRLGETGLWSEERFLALAQDEERAKALEIPVASLEGYLFPATYPLKKSMTEENIIELMLERGRKEKTAERLELADKLGFSWHQVLTLASMIQAETSFAEEMPTIASVFLNRLKQKMRLQCDPTAIYGFKDLKDGVTTADLKRDTPYNTYRRLGLPPGPIGNPGTLAINAALNPEPTGYLYFVADGEGHHLFAVTFEEHKKNVNQLRAKR